ncbi:MAG: hypothetical protein Q8O34_02140 [Rhodocyclaceae bacterium]|nr:hypothetical protein [Rhodocyclaceae bacterium]
MPSALNFRPTPQPPRPWLVLLLCSVYLLAGMAGHDPWKAEDAIHLGVAHGFFAGDGDWRVPQLAGEPWPQAEPLYPWLAAATAWLSRWWLPFHDGARLASAVFGAIYLFCLAGAARALHGPQDHGAGWIAPLLAIGTLGLIVPLHEAQPATAAIAAAAAAYWGIALMPERVLAGTLLAGGGLGLGFLAGGLSAILPVAPLLLLPLLGRRWPAALLSAALALILAAGWLVPLAQHFPAFLDAWWASEVSGISLRGNPRPAHAELLVWFAWPALPLALWAAWANRLQLFRSPHLLPLAGALLALAWFLAHEPKPMPALPLVAPLVLLAAGGAGRLRRGAAAAFDWFGMMTFTLVLGLVWLGSSAMLAGWPPRIARNFAKLAPGFVAEVSVPALMIGLAITAMWVLLLVRLPRSSWRATSRWAGGITVMWALVTTLWLPWIDHGKTYRSAAEGLRKVLAQEKDGGGCIARSGLGASQRASLDYFAGIRTLPRSASTGCRWLLAQEGSRKSARPGWTEVWEGGRPGDRHERLRLYRATP